MPLSDDQKAMLRLLAQREQGYEDIAALMGLSVDDVRAKVRDALAQLEDEGVAAPTLPPEPAEPKQPEPEPEPPAVEAPPTPPEPPAKAEPKPKPSPRPPVAPTSRPPAGPPKVTLPAGKGARAGIAAGIAAVIVVVVILIVSGGGGGDSTTTSASTTGTETSGEAESTTASNKKEVTKAILEPVAGENGSGVAIFGRVKNSLALQVVAKDLDPLPAGQSYTVWLAQSARRMLPLATTPLNKQGRIASQFEVPTEVLAYLANGTFDQLVVTRTDNARLEASLAKATKVERAPDYTGTEVLRGTVTGPIVGAALRKEAEAE